MKAVLGPINHLPVCRYTERKTAHPQHLMRAVLRRHLFPMPLPMPCITSFLVRRTAPPLLLMRAACRADAQQPLPPRRPMTRCTAMMMTNRSRQMQAEPIAASEGRPTPTMHAASWTITGPTEARVTNRPMGGLCGTLLGACWACSSPTTSPWRGSSDRLRTASQTNRWKRRIHWTCMGDIILSSHCIDKHVELSTSLHLQYQPIEQPLEAADPLDLDGWVNLPRQ